MAVVAVLAAGGGAGRRPIALARLKGRPLFVWSLDALRGLSGVASITLLAPEPLAARVAREAPPDDRLPVRVVAVGLDGAAAYLRALREALASVPDAATVVALHDVTIPVVAAASWVDALAGVDERTACAVAQPVHDTIKLARPDGMVYATPPRAALRALHTPLLAPRATLERALAGTGAESDADRPAAEWLTALVSRLLAPHGGDGARLRLVPAGVGSMPVRSARDLSLAAGWVADAFGARG